MNDGEALFQTVADDPSCDTARLVYADWLEEHGDQPAAIYLRTELELAKLPLDSLQAPQLRNQLWQAWATVDPGWLMRLTQPRMLRANPTPFPSAWTNRDLSRLREWLGHDPFLSQDFQRLWRSSQGRSEWEGVYRIWPYDSLPILPLDELRGEFQYLTEASQKRQDDEASNDCSEVYRQINERMLATAAAQGVRLPEAFVQLMSDPALLSTVNSYGRAFHIPSRSSDFQATPSGEGIHALFCFDTGPVSQNMEEGCCCWDLYLHPSGGHCVIARALDFFELNSLDPHDAELLGPRAWFVAPSFEAFLYRMWVERQVSHIRLEVILRGEAPPAIQAYMDHYRHPHKPGS